MKTVVILAAGKGTRLGPKTKFFPKALIKVGDKAAISHIIEYFPKENYRFVIAVGHLGDLVKQYVKIAHPDISVSFVEAEKPSGPGYALEKCRPNIPGEFYIWNCDTLIQDKELHYITKFELGNADWIGYAQVESRDKEYSCIEINEFDRVTNFFEKGENYTGNAYVGCAFIKNYELFWEGMHREPKVIEQQYQVSAGFKFILKHDIPVFANKVEWFDTGNLEALQRTKDHFKGKIENLDKEDEEIYFFEGYVVKYFFDEKMAENRAKRNLTLGNTVPKLISKDKNFYSYEYVEGQDLFHVLNPEDYVSDLFKFMQDNLWIEKELTPEQCSQFHEACVDFYYRKTKKRIEQLFSKLHMYDQETVINGVTIPKIFDLLSVVSWKNLLNGVPTLMHGDFNFSNVLLTNEGFKLIDWRQDFGGIIEFGDMYYDLAKFYSGLLFPHDVVKNKQYEISVNGKEVNYKIENINSPGLNKYKKSHVRTLFRTKDQVDNNKVRQLAALVLINMAPLHEYPLNILLYYQGKDELWKALKK